MKRKKTIPYVPESIIFQILLENSAKFCHEIGRFVSKSWGSIISSPNFIEAHLIQDSNPNFILGDSDRKLVFFEVKQGKFIKRWRFNTDFLKTKGTLLDSSDGFLLFETYKPSLCILNLVTMQDLELQLPILDKNPISFLLDATISCSSSSHPRKIRVICRLMIFHPLHPSTVLWKIVTIGVNKYMLWRTLNHTIYRPPVFPLSSIGHFVIDRSQWHNEKWFLAVDLDDESFHLVHGPPVEDKNTLRGGLIPMGRHLYAVSIIPCLCSPSEAYSFSIWKMRDFRSSKWEEVFKVEIDKKTGGVLNHNHVLFRAWLENRKILIFTDQLPFMKIIVYNFERKEVRVISRANGPHFLHHTNSLVSW